MIPPVDQRLVGQDRYHLLWRKKWRHREDGHITLKEGRVALSSLKRTCRSARLHDKWKLTLTDNLSCLAAFERGRAISFALNQLCRTAAAYAMSCGVRWRLRHVETKRNPADKDSRFDNQRQHGVFAKHHKNFPFDRGKLPGLAVDSVSKGNPLPSSTTSVRGSATAISGRGGTKETPTAPGPGEVERQSASQHLAAELGGGKRNHGRASVNAKPLVLGNQTSTSSASRSGTTSRSNGMFLEIFSGSGRLTAAVRDTGAATLSPVEVKLGTHFDMRRRSSQMTVLAWVRSGRIAYRFTSGRLAPFSHEPDTTFPTLRERKKRNELDWSLRFLQLRSS